MGLLLEVGKRVEATRALEAAFNGLVIAGTCGTVSALDARTGFVSVRFDVRQGSVSVEVPVLGLGYLRKPRTR